MFHAFQNEITLNFTLALAKALVVVGASLVGDCLRYFRVVIIKMEGATIPFEITMGHLSLRISRCSCIT